MTPNLYLWLIPVLPLAGATINGLFGKRFSRQTVLAIALGFCGAAFVMALWIAAQFSSLALPHVEKLASWIRAGDFQVDFAFYLDQLSLVMLLVVTGVGFLIHIYSVGYMWEEGGFYRFFAYLNLFMFFMLTLVLASNYLLMFIGWEGVGLASYLLIGFWFTKDSAASAGKKAFIVNRIGDFGFLIALFLMIKHFGSLDFTRVFTAVQSLPSETAGVGLLTAIGLLLMVGAAGKSAQIPLYVWLPDAMAGPTPVSALIHAATMVTAGVYMVARSSAIYLKAPAAMEAVAIVGLATAFFAATIGLAQNDIKKVFAYSTVSQLGYMFLGAGVGAFSAGIYHLVTHAFFKALLFLGAGSVIHALGGEQDVRNMGGLRKKIPWTFWTMMCASVAIAGVPPFAGFYSKDAILAAADRHAPWMYWVGVITAGMTAFYVFRAMFLAFFGNYRGKAHPHESPFVMVGPLAVLAALSLAGGKLFNVPEFLAPLFPLAQESNDIGPVVVSVAFGLAGIALAWLFYVFKPGLPDRVAATFSSLYKLIYNKYFVDEIYDATVVTPVVAGSRVVLWKGIDVAVIDGAVNGVANRARGIGGVLKRLQSGNIRSYAAC